MKKIHLLAVGGTIASVSSDPLSCTNYKTILNGEAVLGTLGRDKLTDVADVTVEDIIRLDSASLTVEHWLTLARRVSEVLEECDGVVITHGTDTMEETAYFLNLCVKSSKPVILTGSMRPAAAISSDAALNLYNAIVAAASDKLHNCGVLVAMNGVLVSARDARKIHPTRPDAFTPIEMGAIGSITDSVVELNYRSAKRHTIDSEFDCRTIQTLPEVRILYAYADAPADWFDQCLEKGVSGIIIAGVGNGNLSTSWKRKVEELKGRITIVRCTRANGLVNRNGSQDDDTLGTVSGGNLPAQKARILLMFALGAELPLAEIQRVFEEY